MKRLSLLAFTILLALPVLAYKMEPEFYALSEEYVSPHIPWAKPYAGGKIRALFIVPRATGREVIETAQRLDLDYEVVLTLSQDELGWTSESGPYAPADGVSADQMSGELGRKLQKNYDVIVTGLIRWDMFPREHLFTIMQKVHDGTGLVAAYQKVGRNKLVERLFAKPLVGGTEGMEFVIGGVPVQALPVLDQMKPEEIVELRQFAKGHMALLNYPGAPRYYQCLTPLLPDKEGFSVSRELHYEYYQSLVVRALIWAAKKEPKIAITAFGPGAGTVDRAALAKTSLETTLQGAAQGLKATVTVRDQDKHVFLSAEQLISAAAPKVALPMLPVGKYFADVILRSGTATVTWASAFFEVTSELNVASVTLDKKAAKPGEAVTAEIKLSQAAPANASVVLSAVDTHGREVLRKTVAAGGKDSLQVPFRLVSPLSEYARVTAYLLTGKPGNQPLWQSNIANAGADLYVPLKRSRGNYAHAVWSAAHEYNSYTRVLHMRQLEACGVDMQTNSPRSFLGNSWIQQQNMDTIPYATRYSYDGKELARTPCLTDPKFLDSHLKGLTDMATELGPCGPRAYTLGDECFLARNGTEVCFSPTCVADLREWLKGQYPDVAALNASWGTSYKSIDEAEPITLADARQLNQPARWFDHRRHMEFVYARMMERAEEAIRKGDAEAEVGFDGPFDTNSWSGNDWWQLMETFDMCNVYFHQPTQWEFLRSFAKPDMLLGLWYGGYFEHRSEDEERLWPWKGILNGFNSMWWYAVAHGSKSICPMDALTPSLTVYPSFRWASEEMQELRSGAGQALMNAKRLDSGIGVHYSQPSVHASTWDGLWGRLDGVWLQTFGVLEDMGLQYTCYAYAQIEGQGIDVKRFPVFILPYSQAISAQEAAALRKYVSEGGVLIADVRPGVFDQHGKAASPGLLDDLFGIKRVPGKGIAKNQTGSAGGPLLGSGQPVELTGLDVDGDVQVADGQALGKCGETPIIITKQTGKGRAVLLNYGFGAAFKVRQEPAALPHCQVLTALLGTAGVRPPASVTTADGPMRHVETVVFQGPGTQYLGFLKYRNSGDEQPATATVRVSGKLHTYDMRTGKYLGNVSEWQSEFAPARAKLFARVPYQVKAVSVQAVRVATEAEAGVAQAPVYECRVGLTTSGGAPGGHWIQLTVTGPDGAVRPEYARNVQLTGGKAATMLPLALNDAPGPWKITARDSISHMTGATTFTVR
jgi:hypothetical protein